MSKKKPIDKVTPELLSIGLRAVGIRIDHNTLDKIIDMVELIEDNGKKTSLKHVAELEYEWEWHKSMEDARLFVEQAEADLVKADIVETKQTLQEFLDN